MSWGNKLIIVFIVFAALMATLVYKATQAKFELVSKDYYQDELRYQDKIDGAANAALEAPISIQVNDEIISIEFPDAQKNANITGEAWFYCSVDATKDKRFVLSVDSTGIQRIERKGLQKGDYQIKISYEINQKKYYVAQQLHLQ
jgi:FixH